MQRVLLIGMGLAAISLAAVLSGCGDTRDEGRPATAKGGVPDRGGSEILAIQTGSGASLRSRQGNSLELTIERPSPRTLYFTDSPERRAQTAPVDRLPTWVKRRNTKRGDLANVALTWHGQGDPGSLAATLLGLSYEGGRLRATLDPLDVNRGEPASLHDDRLGVEPFSNRSVSMVVDGANYNRCFAEIDTDDYWQLESSSVERDAWVRGPPQSIGSFGAIIGSESDSIWYGCEFSVRYGDGEGDGVTIKVDNPAVGSASYSCQGFGKGRCENYETNYYEERYEALMHTTITHPEDE